MRIFNNHQHTNLMAVLVKGQPFSLIDQLTTPITTRMATKTHYTSTPQAGRPPADHQPPADRRATSWDSPYQQKGACRQDLPSHPTTEGQLKGPAAGNTTPPSAKTTCDHYSTGENNNKQERKHS